MMSLFTKKTDLNPKRSLGKFFKRARNEESGAVAIEFAMITPVMLLVYFGLVEISLLVQADRNVTQAASLVGDLASQDPELDLDSMENYINAALAVLALDKATASDKVGVELTSYKAEASATPAPSGSTGNPNDISEVGYASYGQPYSAVVTIPTDGSDPIVSTTESTRYDATQIDEKLLPAGGGIIVARINYTYVSPLQIFVKSPTLRETFFLKPRRSATVDFDNGTTGSDTTNMRCEMSGSDKISCVSTSS